MRYLLAGGVAANLHGSVSATRDVDILVPPDTRNMARLLRALSELPSGVARERDAAEIATKPITIIGDDPRVDVLTVAWTVTFERAWNLPGASLVDIALARLTGSWASARRPRNCRPASLPARATRTAWSTCSTP